MSLPLDPRKIHLYSAKAVAGIEDPLDRHEIVEAINNALTLDIRDHQTFPDAEGEYVTVHVNDFKLCAILRELVTVDVSSN